MRSPFGHVTLRFSSAKFRNFGADITRPYVRAIESRRIPHVLAGGRSFHDREEIICASKRLTAIEWPDDEQGVRDASRPIFSPLATEALLVFRQQVDGQRRPSKPAASIRCTGPIARRLIFQASEVADTSMSCRLLNVRRNHRPIAETISTLLVRPCARTPGIALWPNGEQSARECQEAERYGAAFFERGASSFRAFVEKLESGAERGEADEAPIVEEGLDGVRVMTVHKAKGLEFPVVVLADPTAEAAQRQAKPTCRP